MICERNSSPSHTNQAQHRAIVHGAGPLLIVAGAGTGKTTAITNRIAHLIASKAAKPSEILALTFTDAAAAEMEARVDMLVPYGFNDVQVSTFHAFGDRVLRDYSIEIGLSPDFKVMTQAEACVFFGEHLFEFKLDYFRPLGNPQRFIWDIISVISRAKDEDVSPKEYLAWAQAAVDAAHSPEEIEESKKQIEIAGAYTKYEELKRKYDLADFGDQVKLTLDLLRTRTSVLARVRKKFSYVLVDEFQDTNYAQFELLKLIAAPRNNITVVGDDDQSIYKFRGACLSNILGFLNAYPKAEQVVLNENYRSSQAILDSSYRLIVHNNPERLEIKSGIDKRLKAVENIKDRSQETEARGQNKDKAQRQKGTESQNITYKVFDTLGSEADAVAGWISEKTKNGNYSYKDIAILVRSNADADPFLKSLNMQAVPWTFSGATGLYRRSEIQLLIAFLSSVANPYDSASFYLLASSDIYQFSSVDMAAITNTASKSNRSLWEVISSLQDYPALADLSAETAATASKLKEDMLRYMDKAKTLSAGQVLYLFLKESGLLGKMASDETARGVESAQNTAKFFEIVRHFGEISPIDRVHVFVGHLKSLISAGDDPASAEIVQDIDAVSVLTVHKAKGLEFPVVFMVCLVEGHFPVTNRHDPVDLPVELIKDVLPGGDFHIQEERRLFYVGMTRAKSELHFSSSKNIGGKRVRRVSRFVLEALDMPRAESGPSRLPKAVETIERFSPQTSAGGSGAAFPLMAEDDVLTLKATAIDDYLTCPLKYKYVHVLRVPVLRHHAAIYGTAIHKAVQALHRARMEKHKITLDDVLAVFKNSWIGEGFVSREHEEERFARGLEVLKNYYNLSKSAKTTPVAVEEEFKFRIASNVICGRWDMLEERKGKTVIVDYKSSDVRSAEDADRRVRESLQLKIYALGYKSKYGRIPDGLELYFIDYGVTGSTIPEEETMAKAQDSIVKAACGIRDRNFEAKKAYLACTYCAFGNICPA